MTDRPEIIMPVTPAGAVEQMLLEELRRIRVSNDQVIASHADLKTDVALVAAEIRRSNEDRSEDRKMLADHGQRILSLENWRAQERGANGVWRTIFGSEFVQPFVSAILGAGSAMLVLTWGHH